jgi:hypothetical protein
MAARECHLGRKLMKPLRLRSLVVISAVLCGHLIASATGAKAQSCRNLGVEGDLSGSADVAVIVGKIASSCSSEPATSKRLPSFFYTLEITCSTDQQAAQDGVCSATPCPNSFFALRTAHFGDGRTEPAGFRCVTLEQAVATPGVSVAQVFEAVRRVELPGGEIGVEPRVRGLANLESFFWVEGANQPPVDLEVGGSTVHAEFRVAEYRWTFGGGESLVTTGAGTPGLDSEVRTRFRRRGVYPVGVTVMWVAEAWLDGRRVGEVDDLVSRAETTYPVAELRTVLTG